MMALLLLQALPLGEAYALGDEKLAPAKPAEAVSVFQRVCLAPFPDPARFDAVAQADKAGLTKVNADETGTVGADRKIHAAVGSMWVSKTVNLRYISSSTLAPSVAQPQCRVSIRLAKPVEQRELAKSVGKMLDLKNPSEIVAGTHIRTYWDLPQADGSRWRVMLKSETCACGNFLSLGVTNLKTAS